MAATKRLSFACIHPAGGGDISAMRGGGLFISGEVFGDALESIIRTSSSRFSIRPIQNQPINKVGAYGNGGTTIASAIFAYEK